MVFAIILLVLLVMSMFLNIGTIARIFLRGSTSAYSHTAGPKLQEMIVEDNEGSDKIAVVKVEGIIMGELRDTGGYSMVEVIRAQLKRAEEDSRVKAVILKVDSPGGEVLASDEINDAIAKFQDRTGKAVIASMGNLAASGGYYVSAPCRWIVANDMTITGSIGVIMRTWNYRTLADKVGLLPQTFKSGKYKDMLSGAREPDSITQEEKDMVQKLIDQTYGKFKDVVQKGRDRAHDKNKTEGVALNSNWTDYADGRVLSGTEAHDLGFVDELGGLEKAVERAKTIAGIPATEKPRLVEYQERYGLADLLKLSGKADAKTLKIDVGLDVPKLKAGQPYFLCPLFVQ